ncbi:Acylpyruvase FAHD1, mitochondrial [Zea mays]|uniref:Acylpyruvase FAHD1, mitochondrial n=1 Tax=Zea mays TaxID=4577 RepID=A0A3L6E1Q8_MAIZE|nr:Acylpyruvase FAHD1, mitochondrial [Zea mays]
MPAAMAAAAAQRLLAATTKIIGVGRNYIAHAKELGNPVPKEHVLFLKPTSSFLHAGVATAAVEIPEPLESLHHEVELAVVISRRGRDVPEASAMDFVGGYALALDMTARDLQSVVSSFSYLLSSDVLITIQSIVNSIVVLLDKSGEPNGKNIHMGCSKATIPFLRKRLGYSAHKLLSADFPSEDAGKGWQSKGDLIQKILQIYLRNSDSTSDLLAEIGRELPKIKQAMKARGSVDTILQEIQKSVDAFVSLIGMCKSHEKVSMHAMAVKHGGKFIDTFLKGEELSVADEIMLIQLKQLQKGTRIIQSICSDAKGNKRTMITSKVPPAKRSMERFLFQVKALLHSCSAEKEFQMGNLKHKDLQGHVVSSQAYGNVDEEDEEQTEIDSDLPADEHDNGNAMEEDAIEGSNETPMEDEEE